jgi:hypothetical protein
MVTFGLVVVCAVISLFVKWKRVNFEEVKDALEGISGVILNQIPTMALVADFNKTLLPGMTAKRSGKGSGEELAKLVIKLIPPLMRVVVSLALERFHNSCALFSPAKGGSFLRKKPL